MTDSSFLLTRSLEVFASLFVLGTLLTLPLYKFNFRGFLRSRVFIKIVFWIPLFIIFLAAVFNGPYWPAAILLTILIGALFEAIRLFKARPKLVFTYFLLFVLGMAHFIFLKNNFTNHFTALLLTIGFATVLADVCAYFMGNYAGKHKLPGWLNPKKSWEGVLGELVGATLGVTIVNIFIIAPPSKLVFLSIGLGSITGDLLNSFVKRKIGVEEWSSFIPGHGGFLDRFASFAGSTLLSYYLLLLVL